VGLPRRPCQRSARAQRSRCSYRARARSAVAPAGGRGVVALQTALALGTAHTDERLPPPAARSPKGEHG
jgi:hypothetical protein